MTSCACIGDAQLQRQIGAWNAKTMVPACVDRHICLSRHVTCHTLRAWRSGFVLVMRDCIVFARRMLMARCANMVSLMLKSSGVRVMAVGTLNSLVIHFALNKRPEDIDFIHDLPVFVVGLRT